jgi:hypothetical protein
MIRVSIRDVSFGHSPFAMGPTPPVCEPTRMVWDRESPADLNTIYTDQLIPKAPDGVRIYLVEPYIHNENLYHLVASTWARFRQIWTNDRWLMKVCPNAVFVPAGGCWIRPVDRRIWPKTLGVSTIASNKRELPGQAMRHEAIRCFPSINPYGIDYEPLPNVPGHKIHGMRDYMFHLACEASDRDWSFSDKLVDCFMTGCVPVYWGFPDTKRFFNKEGIIRISGVDHLAAVLPTLTPELYASMAMEVAENFERAKEFCLVEDWLVAKGLVP